jgi:hypothetical protein
MKKIFILVLMVLVGISLFSGLVPAKASESRTIPHKFRAFTESTSVAQGITLYRITGKASASNGVFGIYNATTLGGASNSVCAVEGGEATSGDALPMYDFGDEGLTLNAGSTIVITGCIVVIEYI